jgi:hypothetical protein
MAIILDGTNGITFPSGSTQSTAGLPLTGGSLTGGLTLPSAGLTFSDATTQASSAIVGGALPISYFPSGQVVQVAYDYISINGALGNAQSYTSSTVITPVTSFSKFLIVASCDSVMSPYAYGTYGNYPIQCTPGTTLSGYTVNARSTFTQTTNAGSQIASNQYISSGGSPSAIMYATKSSGSWTTANTFQYTYTAGAVYGGTNWGNMTVIFYLIK